LIPAKWHLSLVRQWWLFTLAVYIAQLRPKIVLERITGFELKGRGEKWVVDSALRSGSSMDAHYVKGTFFIRVGCVVVLG
jgi:hypothetical protein